MSVAGVTQWRVCEKCGRRFLGIEKKENNSSDCFFHCPECRAEMARKVVRDITDKWLKDK